MASTENTPGTGAINQVIGKVSILYGTVKAIAPDGTVRVLAPNSPVYANEQIITESDGSVAIMLDGPPPAQLNLGRMTTIVLDEDVYAGVTPEMISDAAAEAEQIQNLLLAGDQPIELEATAAGGTASAGGGHPVVKFDLTGDEVIPLGGAETIGIMQPPIETIEGDAFETEPTGEPVDNVPTGGVTAATLDDEGLSGGIPGGTGDIVVTPDPDSNEATFSGMLSFDFGGDGAGSIDFASMNGTSGTVGTETVSYSWSGNTLTATGPRGVLFTVEVTNPATGAYTVTLVDNVLHETLDGLAGDNTENDAAAALTYTVTDADGSTAPGTLNVTFDDDMPSASSIEDGGTFDEGTTGNVVAPDAAVALGINAGADGLEGTLQEIAFTGGQGTLSINAQGQLIYTAPAYISNNDGSVDTTFSYTVTDKDGDTVTKSVTVSISDTGVGTVTATNELVDEDDLPVIGNNDSALGDDNPVSTGSISYTVGADGLGGVSLSTAGNTTSLVTLAGDAVDTVFVPSGTGGMLVGYVRGTDATVEANWVFSITLKNVTATGAEYDTVLYKPVEHLVTDDPSTEAVETAFEDNLGVTVNVTVTDGDGSYSAGSFTVTIDDDMPSNFTPQAQTIVNIAGGVITGDLDTAGHVGADQPGTAAFSSFTWSGNTIAADGATTLTSDGNVISVSGFGTSTLTGTTTEGTVFTATLNVVTGIYEFDLVKTIDNGAGVQFNNLSGGTAGNPPFKIVESTTADNMEALFTPISADSVNSDSDDVGVGGQFIDIGNPDQGLRVDFGDFTFHDNGGSPSTNGFTIVNHTTVNGFKFTIDQISGGTTADVLLKTYNANEGDPNQTIAEHNFADDILVPITEVQIFDAFSNWVGTATGDATFGNITVDFFADGTVTVTGLSAQYSLVTSTSSGYDRLEILNAGTADIDSTDGKFSLSHFQVETIETGDPINMEFGTTLTDADGDTSTGAISLTIDPVDADSVITGGSGSDALLGGAGDDTLTGGLGADTFKVGEGHDTIMDYSKAEGDVVDISHVLDSAEGDHSRLGVIDNAGKAELVIYNDAAHTTEIGSVTFDTINFSDLTSGDELNSLLGQVDVDHTV